MRGPELFDIFDPRGRANRKGILILAAILLLAQACVHGACYLSGLELKGPASWVIHSLFIWLGIAAVSKRLHDFGISAWWLLWGMIGMTIWSVIVSVAVFLSFGMEAATPGSPAMDAAMLAMFAPLIVLTIWMHFYIGAEGDNSFGPVPGASGFSKPHPRVSAEQQTAMTVFAG